MCSNDKPFFETDRKPKHICKAYRCGKKRLKGKKYCSRHMHMYRKWKDPIAHTYYLLMGNAKRRGKVFTISLEYFRKWCKENDYIKKKGRMKKSLTIDRIDNEKGYEEGNLQLLTNSANISKYWNIDYSKPVEGCPF